MPNFWKRRRPTEPIESLLVEHRPEPRREFARSIVDRVGAGPERTPRLRTRPLRARFGAAAALTAVALVGATAAAGGVGPAAHGLTGFVNVGHTFGFVSYKNTSSDKTNHHGNDEHGKRDDRGDGDNDNGPGEHEYSVKICHATGSTSHPYVELRLPPQEAAKFLAHHPGDFIAPPQGCPGLTHHH